MLRTLTNEKLQLERKLQLTQEQPTPSLNEKINEKMLKTIRFKSTMCQQLEQELHQKQEEIVMAKSENFKLIKS